MIGEPTRTGAQRAAAYCVDQVQRVLEDTDLSRVILAYEPVWAIGGAQPAGPGTLPELREADGLFLGRFAHEPRNFGTVLDDAIQSKPNL